MTFLRRALPLLALLLAAVTGPARAECPEPGTVLFPGIEGQALIDSLRVNFRPPINLTYNTARDHMYAEIDNHGGVVTGIYTGFTAFVDPQSTTPRADAFAADINAEHTWPQSKFSGSLPMEADLHHLFPIRVEANGARANLPFAEIDDANTDKWFRLNQEVTTPVAAQIDEYSELDTNVAWEPREVQKGNTARAMFYFYTVYRGEADAADPHFIDAQKDDLRRWNAEDPPDSAEWVRTCAVAQYQGGRVNPFVIDPTLVDRAYFGGVPVVLAYFGAGPVEDGVELTWRTTVEKDHLGFHVWRSRAGAPYERRSRELVRGGPEYRFLDRDVEDGVSYEYEIESLSRTGAVERFGPVSVTIPAAGRLAAIAAPNPARGPVTVVFRLPEAAVVRMSVFDAAGRLVHEFPAERLSTGRHAFDWDGGAQAPGVYFYRIAAGPLSATGRLVVTR